VRLRSVPLAVVLATLAVSIPALAHHSFSMFDNQSEKWIEGTVTEFQWTNPHSFIQLSVAGENGRSTVWSLEGGSPNILSRNGWNRLVLKPGDKVRVLIYPLRSGEPGGSFLEVHREDGKVFYYHG
jgi:hypothetical protein